MKFPGSLLLLWFTCMFPLFAEEAAREALGSLAWKKFAREISQDPAFQADIRRLMHGLKDDAKASVSRSVSKMIAGNGVEVTGTVADSIVCKALRSKAEFFLPADHMKELEAMSDDALLALVTGKKPAGREVPKEDEDEKDEGREVQLLQNDVRIVLALDNAMGLDPTEKNPVKLSKRPGTFRLVRGLSDRKMVSFESSKEKGHFLRHFWGKVQLQKRPEKETGTFDADATYRMIKRKGSVYQFEAVNWPGRMLRVDEEGTFRLDEVEDQERARFQLLKSKD